MNLDIYVNYRGTCEQAFRFYEQHLAGTITGLVRHREQPNPHIAEDWKEKVRRTRIEIGSTVVMGADTEQTPFANRFAMLRDRFGTSWMLLHQPGSERESSSSNTRRPEPRETP